MPHVLRTLRHRLSPDMQVWLGLSLVVVIFFVTKWLSAGLFVRHDLITIYAPLEDLYARLQRQGTSIWWAPELSGGYPLLANGQLGFFYLPHLVLRQFLPGIWVINISLLLHSLLAVGGMYYWLRWNKVVPGAAVVAGLLFTFGGAMTGKYEIATVVFAAAWTPLLLLLLQRWLATGRYHWLWWWVAASVLHVMSGHPQIALFVLGLEAVWVVALWSSRLKTVIRLGLLLGAGLLVVGITLIHIAPIIALVPETDRAHGLTQRELLDFSFVPEALRGLVQAHPFGHFETYQGPKNEPELATFLGWPAVLLALVGLVRGPRRERLWYFAVGVVVVGLLLALGQASPLYRWLVTHGFHFFSVPARFFWYVYLGIVILASFGFQTLLTWRGRFGRPWHYHVLALLVVALPLIVGWGWYPKTVRLTVTQPTAVRVLQAEPGPVRIYSRQALSDNAPHNNFGIMVWNPVTTGQQYEQTFISPFTTITGIKLRLAVPSVTSANTLHVELLAPDTTLLSATTLPLAHIVDSEWTTIPFKEPVEVGTTSLRLRLTSDVPRAQAARLYLHTNPQGDQYDPTGILSQCQDSTCTEVRANGLSTDLSFAVLPAPCCQLLTYDLLSGHAPAGFGLGSSEWIGALALQPVVDYFKFIQDDRYDTTTIAENRSLVNRFPITHVLGAYAPYRTAANLPGFTEISSAVSGEQFVKVFRNDQAFPHVAWAKHVVAAVGVDAQLSLLPTLGPQDVTTVVADIPTDTTFDASGSITPVGDTRSRITLRTQQAAPGFLVVRDVVSSGWQVAIDEVPATLQRVDGLFRGVIIPPGTHQVVWYYQPQWLHPVVLVTSLSLLSLISWGMWLGYYWLQAKTHRATVRG